MLRRNKKREETNGQDNAPISPGLPPYMRTESPALTDSNYGSSPSGSNSLYMQGSAPNSSSSNLASARYYTEKGSHSIQPQQQYAPHHHNSQQRSAAGATDAAAAPPPSTYPAMRGNSAYQTNTSNAQNRPMPASASIDVMGPPPQPGYHQTNNNQSSSGTNQTTSMGRSQSAFNFIISKAKGTFSSGSANQQSQQQQQQQHTPHPMSNPAMNASSSLSSIYSAGGNAQPSHEEQIRTENSRTRNRAASSSSSLYAPVPPPVDRTSADMNSSGRYGVSSRPSFGDDYGMPASSPTKKSIFGRERKASNNSIGRPDRGNLFGATARQAFTHSPLGRRQDFQSTNSSNTVFSPFSKSQSDLHSKQDFPSPASGTVELPAVISHPSQNRINAQNPYNTGDPNLLRSPSPNVAFSRSVDDLSRGHTPPPPPISPTAFTSHGTPAVDNEQSYNQAELNWGEHGVVSNPSDRIRASDIGTLKQEKRRGGQNVGMGLSNVPLASSMSTSTSMNLSGWPNSGITQASGSSRHQRKSSKTLANAQTARPQPNLQRPAFASGTQYDGLLNRNTQISMSVNQLSEGGGGLRGGVREKDIGKGWKPYRVTLQDGKLLFFKPQSSIADDVKTLFPTSIVTESYESHALLSRDANQETSRDQSLSIDGLQGLSVDDIQRNKLGTKDLLAATSGSSSASNVQQRPPPRRNATSESRLSAILDAVEPDLTTPTASSSWERKGRHENLVLTSTRDIPQTWAERISGGSVDALSHEYVFASQANGVTTAQENGVFLFAILVTLRRTSRPLQGFLVAVHKWATAITRGSSAEDDDAPNTKEELEKNVNSRLSFLVDAGIAQFTDEQSRSSVLLIIEDIVRDIVMFGKDDDAINARIANLRQAVQDLEIPQRSVGDNLSNETFALTTSALLKMDPSELGRQIHAFYIEHLSKELLISKLILPLAGASDGQLIASNLVSFDSSHPNFLTTLVLEHVLGNEKEDQRERGSLQEAKERAALLRHWIAVASYLIKLQNMSAWVAICAALCSRAISRLTLTWRFVAATDRMLVSSAWAPALVNLGWTEMPDAQIGSMIEATPSVKSSMSGHQSANPLYGFLPFLGNALSRFQISSPAEAISGVMPISDSIKIAAQLWSVQEVWQSYGNSSKEVNLRPVQIKDDNIQKSLLRLSQHSRSHKTVDHNAPLRLSLKLESAWLGDDSTPAWHPAMSKSTSACALSPLSFKEPLPNLSLVDPTWIVNTIKKESKDPLAKTLLNSTNSNESPDMDRESTITMRSRRRPTLSASPLTRSKAFGSMTGTSVRPLHGVPFANIIEWTPGYQAGADELIIRVGSDLILNVLNEVPSSIPSSPMTSKRFSQEFTRGSRPVSIASKRSSLPPSERNSLVDPIAAPIQVVVKAATLERLVDILVMDVQHLSASLASDEVLERVILANKRSRISIDIGNYRKVFLATFRVHCKPIVLFDYLRKRLLAAINAGSEMALPLPHRPNYPTWSRVESVNSPTQQVDWEIVAKIRQGVTSVLSQWINTYPQDFVEDPQLFESVDGLLKEVAIVHEKQSIQDEGDHAKLQIALKDIMRQMRLASMTSQTEKKAAKRSSKRVSNKGTSSATSTPKLDENAKTERMAEFDIDQASAHELVEYLESVIKVFSEKIDERDLLVVYDTFYRQSHDPLAWHVSSSQQQGTQHNPDELPPINNMYKLLELVRWPPRDSQSVYHRLPASIRDACASQSLLRGWCAVQIIEPRIGLMKRQARITKLIDAVWICRARMCNNRMEEMSSSPLSPAFVYQEPTIASFVESVLIGALTSSESRLFVRAWQQVAVERSGNCDSLASLIPPREIADKYRESTQLNSTLDVGWLLKSMAQAVLRVSDLIQEESSLIDFDKQRTVWTLIESSAGRVKSGMIDHNLVDLAGARLNVIQTTLRRVQWDRRAFKEDNAAEAASISPVPDNLRIMRGSRPLIELMIVQQDKFKRDRIAFEILSIQTEQANQRNAAQKALQSGTSGFGRQPLRSNNNNLNSPNFGPTLIPNPASASEKKTRRMTALFRGAVRPMGLMSTSGNERSTIQEMPNKSLAELLPLIPTQKPSSTVLCGSGRISVWRNGQRSFVMNFSPPEGGHILLQAHNSAELQGWCSAIERASKEFSSHTSHALPPQKQNISGSTPKSSKGPSFPLYGTDLKLLAESEGQSVPLALTRMMEQVEKRGLREQGIYRISGAKSAIEALKVAFNTQPALSVNLAHGETSDVHTIAGAIKQWFRDLPEPVIPFNSYHALINAERLENEEERLYAIRDIIWDFPRAHFELLKRVSEHLSLVCQEGQYNLMAPHNIGLVFGTSLLNPPPGPASVAESFGNIGKAAHIVKILVTMHEWLFEPEPEPEVESEVPVESPPEDAAITQGEKEINSTNTDLEKNIMTNDTDRMTIEQPITQMHELIIDPHHDGEEEPTVTEDTDQLQKTSFEAVDEEEMEELGENEEVRSQWLHNPLVTVDEGTVDSHASDSSIMRAVLGVNSSTSMPKTAIGGESVDTVIQNEESKEQPLLTTIPKVEIDQPESEDVSRANSTQQEFLDVQEDLSVQSTARQHTRQSSNNAIGRDRVVESVYLDATDAIAILQNPFEEEEEEGQESEVKQNDD